MKTYDLQSKKTSTQNDYLKGQELIWDSGAGFDVVTYQGESTLFKGIMAFCQMKTGIKKGKVLPIGKDQLNVFSLKKWAELRVKYQAC